MRNASAHGVMLFVAPGTGEDDHDLNRVQADLAARVGPVTLRWLKKALAERALNAEMEHHLSTEAGAGNSRNGYGRKTVVTDTGPMPLDIPRERAARFEPQLVAKHQRRLTGLTAALGRDGWRPIASP